MGTMKTILLMFAILILAVSMIACGASQNSQTQTTPTVLGSWTGIITGPAPYPSSMWLQFGAGQGAYGLPVGGSLETFVDYNYSCEAGAEQVPVVINGANFTMNNTNPEGTIFQMTGTVTGAGTGNTVTGTITFPNLCGSTNTWTGEFTATGGQYNGSPSPGATITGGWTGTITGLGNVPGSFAGTSEFQFNAPGNENGMHGTSAFSIAGCGSVSAVNMDITQSGLNFTSNGQENVSNDAPGYVILNGAVSSDGHSISGTIYFVEPCSPNLEWEANFSATSQ